MIDYQIQRIKEKLIQAKILDKDFKVFGADSHEYHLDQPIDMKTVEDFEKKHKISLPNEYKLFVTEIGNGGISFSNSGAGPYYGIFSFGEDYDLFGNSFSEKLIQNPVIIFPNMTDEFWNTQIDHIYEEGVSDDEFELREAKLFGGVLAIGTQGCTYYHCLILNGEHQGKIVNIDVSYQKPQFSFEANFLDWYERWLDDIIEGNLTKENAGSFGYQMGGKEEKLMNLFQISNDEIKEDILYALLYKKSISDDNLHYLYEHYEENNLINQVIILKLLVIHQNSSAHELLEKMYNKSLLDALQITHWYIKTDLQHWVELVKKYIPTIKDKNAFDFATYILAKDEFEDFSALKPFILYPESSFRKTALYTFSLSKNKITYENEFLIGLNTEDSNELIQALQAIEGLKTKAILKKLQELVVKYPYKEVKSDKFGVREYNLENDDSIFITNNLVNVLQEYGLNYHSILEIDPDNFEIDGK